MRLPRPEWEGILLKRLSRRDAKGGRFFISNGEWLFSERGKYMYRFIRVVLLFSLMILLATPALAQSADIERTMSWLQEQRLDDGGFSDGFSEESSVGATADAVLAAVAAGADASTWGSPSPLDFMAAQAGSLENTGDIAKTILVAVATGQDPASFGGVDLLTMLETKYDAETGRYEGLVTAHAMALLALKNAGEPIPAAAVDALKATQADDGGWAFDGQSQPDTNTTALAIQTLVAAGEPTDGEVIVNALTFLQEQQNENGGFPYQKPSDFGTETDANSTAWVIQALLAAGQDLAEWNDPQAALAALQMESGAFQWKAEVPGENFLATVQAVPALAGVHMAELPVVNAAQPPGPVPATLPETGGTRRPVGVALAALGMLVLGLGAMLRRRHVGT